MYYILENSNQEEKKKKLNFWIYIFIFHYFCSKKLLCFPIFFIENHFTFILNISFVYILMNDINFINSLTVYISFFVRIKTK